MSFPNADPPAQWQPARWLVQFLWAESFLLAPGLGINHLLQQSWWQGISWWAGPPDGGQRGQVLIRVSMYSQTVTDWLFLLGALQHNKKTLNLIIRSDRISIYRKNVQMDVWMYVCSKASNVTHVNQD